MRTDNDPFQPEHIDELIERLAQRAQQEEVNGADQSEQLVRRLQQHYTQKKRQDTLRHAWEHISQKQQELLALSAGEGEEQGTLQKQERSGLIHMQLKSGMTTSLKKTFPLRTMLVALVAIVLMIGAAVLMSRFTQAGGTGSGDNPGSGGRSGACVSSSATKTPDATPCPPSPTPTPAHRTPPPSPTPTPAGSTPSSPTPTPAGSVPTPRPPTPTPKP